MMLIVKRVLRLVLNEEVRHLENRTACEVQAFVEDAQGYLFRPCVRTKLARFQEVGCSKSNERSCNDNWSDNLPETKGRPKPTLKYIPILRLKTRHYVFQTPRKRSFHTSLSPYLSAVQTLDDVTLARNVTGCGRFRRIVVLVGWLSMF